MTDLRGKITKGSTVISGLSLLSKNLENAISQKGKSEKYFYALFLIHMVVEF